MMNDFEELRTRKQDVEQAILKMINQLEIDFGVTVNGINQLRTNFSDGRTLTSNIDIRIVLSSIL